MAPRSSWKAFLKLSLVSVPVRGFTASKSGGDIRLNQLHKDCNTRVKYQKVCPEHGELTSDQIVKGYEHSKGEYVIIEDDELEKLRTQSDHSINIEGFIPPDALDPVYHAGRTYYLVPDGTPGQKPYALLHRGMQENGVHALAQVVIGGREQIVLLRPIGDLLGLTVLYHHAKVQSSESLREEVVDVEVSDEELALANTLIGASRMQDFDLASYDDRYHTKLTELIRMKVEGQEVVQAEDAEEPKIINLMDALKKSVAEAQKAGATAEEPDAAGSPKKAVSPKKMAPSAGARHPAAKKKAV